MATHSLLKEEWKNLLTSDLYASHWSVSFHSIFPSANCRVQWDKGEFGEEEEEYVQQCAEHSPPGDLDRSPETGSLL